MPAKPSKADDAKAQGDKHKLHPAVGKGDEGKADKEKGKRDEARKPDEGTEEMMAVPPIDVAAGAPGEEIKQLKGKAKRAALKERADKLRESREQRKQSARQKQRREVTGLLKGQPMHNALNQELKRNARRLARLDRILALAAEAGDDKSVGRVETLLDKETARHARWMANYAANPGGDKDEADKDKADKDKADKDKADKDKADKDKADKDKADKDKADEKGGE